MNTILKCFAISAALLLATIPATATTRTAATACTGRQTADTEPQFAVFNVFTYKEDGTRLADGYGFFITADGTGVAPYSLFKGAVRAEVIDYKGHSYTVKRILGASSSYDLVKFSVEDGKKLDFLPLATTACENGTNLTLATYTNDKKTKATAPVKVENSDDYFDYKYYDVTASNTDKNVGCPLVNAEDRQPPSCRRIWRKMPTKRALSTRASSAALPSGR